MFKGVKHLTIVNCWEVFNFDAIVDGLESLKLVGCLSDKTFDLGLFKNIKHLHLSNFVDLGIYFTNFEALGEQESLYIDFKRCSYQPRAYDHLKNVKDISLLYTDKLEDVSWCANAEKVNFKKAKALENTNGLSNVKRVELYGCYYIEDFSGLGNHEYLDISFTDRECNKEVIKKYKDIMPKDKFLYDMDEEDLSSDEDSWDGYES